ncbi:hypothetical protein [Haloprofundus halophilus]|uniref:hypothetical protein n=1 Tax=Haloprofundus halophilus TaxID=2283527 RepID=UPI000E44D1E6|nr:hypothetical protein [Haloprofundus halophilus]
MTDAAETVDRLLDGVRQELSASDEESDDRLRELAEETSAFVDETTTEDLIKAVGLTDDDGDHVETIPNALAVGGEESVLDLKTILALSKTEGLEDEETMGELRERLSELTAEADEAERTAESEAADEDEVDAEAEATDGAESEAVEAGEAETEASEEPESESDDSLLTALLQSQLDGAADSLRASVEQMQADDEEQTDEEAEAEADVEDEEDDDGLLDVGDDGEDRGSRGRATMHSTVPKSRRDMNGVARHSTVPKR